MEEADGRFGHGDASIVAHAFLEQHFCDIGHGKNKDNLQSIKCPLEEKHFV